MAENDEPNSKYQCLRDAVSAIGAQNLLPPIKPGSEVEEVPPYDMATKPGQTQSSARFHYIDETGKKIEVEGMEFKTDHDFNQTEFAIGILQDKYPYNTRITHGDVFFNSKGIIDTSEIEKGEDPDPTRSRPSLGQVSETVAKLLKCRDPGTS